MGPVRTRSHDSDFIWQRRFSIVHVLSRALTDLGGHVRIYRPLTDLGGHVRIYRPFIDHSSLLVWNATRGQQNGRQGCI